MLIGIGIGILGILTVLTARSITTLLHELGHAIPALLFTEEEVTVYVGSYGDIKKSLPVHIGRLKLFLKFNILDWKLGLCTHRSSAYYIHDFIIILGGPLISFMLAVFLSFLMFLDSIGDATKIFISLFILSTVWDFLVNIFPVARPLKLHNGNYTYNDGFQLIRMFKLGASIAEFDKALYLLEQNDVVKGIGILKRLGTRKPDNRLISNAITEAYIDQHNFREALQEFDRFHQNNKVKDYEYLHLGDIYVGLRQWEPALKAFDQYLYHVYNDFEALNKKAAALVELGFPNEALRELGFSLQNEPQNNLNAFLLSGQIYRQQKNWQDAEQAINKALVLKPKSPKVHLQLAFLQEAKHLYKEALQSYKKAQQLGSIYHGIDYKINAMEQLLEKL